MRTVLKDGVPIPWDKDRIKENIWWPIQRALFGSESTADLEPKQVNEVLEVLQPMLAEKHGITTPFGREL